MKTSGDVPFTLNNKGGDTAEKKHHERGSKNNMMTEEHDDRRSKHNMKTREASRA